MRASSVESAILQTLDCDTCHLTAREILDTIRPRLSAVNPSTIYRALERLVSSGRVSVSDIGQGAAVYELVQDMPHHHLVCQNCGTIVILERRIVEYFLQQVTESTTFHVTTNHLIIFGECESCKEQQA